MTVMQPDLAGTVEDVAAWVLHRLGDRFAYTRPDHWESVWWRWTGRRWGPCPYGLVLNVVRTELDNGYFSLPLDVADRKADRLLDQRWVETSLMPVLRQRLFTDGTRP